MSKTVRALPSSICKIREGEADDEIEVEVGKGQQLRELQRQKHLRP